ARRAAPAAMVHSDRREPDPAAALDAREEGTASAADDVCHGRFICAHMDRPDSCGPDQPGLRLAIPDARGGHAVFRVVTAGYWISRQRTGAAPRHAPIAGDAARAAGSAMGGESERRARPC